ncbi:P-loop containing nucleoside triphosphate hydrolase protein [Tilletiaria anomala UBC 951]|uniref:dTMP kinase n=1 Tax=Tilletiaria anomala (strain ATCC 24038 / CBS 436.72 / UBC 951) TaxID=1037660 RepID=A0A066VF68_TILAU|nr:P-loop containing nucleoside triphosphate hydrolase protein [Tilletiaria anomala UBC 951]KDN38943.1 P-loop containing nucleoside triphosphate hydrolase protein [Tilletiaria anomala UBC 951]
MSTVASAPMSGQHNTDPRRRRRGNFIVVEGLDRAGKSTQVDLLVQRFLRGDRFSSEHREGVSIAAQHQRDAGSQAPASHEEDGPTAEAVEKAIVYKFPDRTTPIGKMIDAYLQSQTDIDDRAIHLLFSANRWEAMQRIKAILSRGTTIICDRYAFSGVAYSVSKSPSTPSSTSVLPASAALSYAWCRAPDSGLLQPDLVIFLDIAPDVARQRGAYGAERYEREDMQRRVREAFLVIQRDVTAAAHPLAWSTIDAGRSVDEVHEEMWQAVQACQLRSTQKAGSGTVDADEFDMSLFTHDPPRDSNHV